MNPKEFVKEYCIKSLVCCFSGGKDSLVATHYTLSELEDMPIDKYVVYVDTGAMLPITTPYVEDVCRKFGWNLIILYGNFFEKAQKWGVPTIFRRWCCWECKLKHIRNFVKNLAPQRGEVTGLRKDESIRRKKILENHVYRDRRFGIWDYAPLLTWTEKDVLSYIKKHNLPFPSHYQLGLKETCMCGAFTTQKELMILKAQFPELFQKFVELEKQFKKGGAAFYFQNKLCYAKDLAKQKTLTDMVK